MKTTLQTTTNRSLLKNAHSRHLAGFTLIELVMVLAIVAAMAAVIAPYAGRSNTALRFTNHCLNIAEAFAYARELSHNGTCVAAVWIDPAAGTYRIEVSRPQDNGRFDTLEGPAGRTNCVGPNIEILDVRGFELVGRRYLLSFEPSKESVSAAVELATADERAVVEIRNGHVQVRRIML